MKPTPGPWHVGETRHEYDCVIRNPDNDPVAIVHLSGYCKLTGKANAHLIAASWELLEAVLPFTQSEFARELGGNELGDDSIVFERNGQRLKIGDFRKAIQAVAKAQQEER